MGVDHSVYLVYGLKIEFSQLREEYEYPSCKHPQPDTTKEVAGVALAAKPKYCAECGLAVRMHKSSRWRKEFADHDEIGGYELLHGSQYSKDSPYYLGELIRFDDHADDMRLDPPDLSDLQQGMQVALKPLGLWDAKKFGVWLVNVWS